MLYATQARTASSLVLLLLNIRRSHADLAGDILDTFFSASMVDAGDSSKQYHAAESSLQSGDDFRAVANIIGHLYSNQAQQRIG